MALYKYMLDKIGRQFCVDRINEFKLDTIISNIYKPISLFLNITHNITFLFFKSLTRFARIESKYIFFSFS